MDGRELGPTAGTTIIVPPARGATKAQLRAWARVVRPQLRMRIGADVDAAVLAALRASEAYRAADTVAIYLAVSDEVDVLGLAADGKRLVAPRMQGTGLTFHELAGPGLEEHPWGVRQPPANASEVPQGHIDLMLVPGLLFDSSGARVGFGKGYYDRVMAPGRAERRPLTVGVAYEALVLPELPVEAHDVPVDYIVSEAGLREARPRPPRY